MSPRFERRAAFMKERQLALQAQLAVVATPLGSIQGRLSRIAQNHDVTVKLILSGLRFPDIVRARAEAAYELRTELGYSFPRIARILNLKDHTSVIYLCRKFDREMRVRQRKQLAQEWCDSMKSV